MIEAIFIGLGMYEITNDRDFYMEQEFGMRQESK